MTTSLLGDIKTQLTPDMVHHLSSPTELAGVLELNSGRNLSEAHTDSATEKDSNEKWEAWKAKGTKSSRPPWWVLLLGIVALSVVYWLWGQGTEVTP